jgi:hypothetical protein
MLLTGSAPIDAQRAFQRMRRERRRAALSRRLGRRPGACDRLAVVDLRTAGASGGAVPGVRTIPLDAICGTLEPSRAGLFDSAFRPAPQARSRWERVWMADQRGAALPPIDVVAVGSGYALRDGHHRVSVARSRGALSIDAVVQRAAV